MELYHHFRRFGLVVRPALRRLCVVGSALRCRAVGAGALFGLVVRAWAVMVWLCPLAWSGVFASQQTADCGLVYSACFLPDLLRGVFLPLQLQEHFQVYFYPFSSRSTDIEFCAVRRP